MALPHAKKDVRPMTGESRNQGTTSALRRWSAIAEQYQAILTLSVPLILYVSLVSWQAYWMRDQINPDAISYIRNAQYITEGRFADSVSGHRCPLLSWCMAPFLYFGLDGLYAARVVLAVWGGAFVLASRVFMQRFARCTVWLQLTALSLIAVSTVREATYAITPDLLLSTLLIVYSTVSVSPRLLQQNRLPVLCGLLGGVAYLAKSYALPFFLLHFAFVVALQRWGRRRTTSLRRAAFAWAGGVLACVVVSAPWIGLLSWKYGRPTFSTSARQTHNFVGPKDVDTEYLPTGMYHLPPGRVFIGETPEINGNDVSWSPLESWDHAKHQVNVIARHTRNILRDVRGFDLLGICLPALVLMPIVTWKPAPRRVWFRSAWTLGTVLIYCSGFTLVYYEPRYIEGFLWPICCIYCLGLVVPSFARLAVKAGLPRRSAWLVAGLVVASFAGRVCERDGLYLGNRTVPRGAFYRMIAQELRSAGLEGPFAADELRPHLGYYVSFHLDEPFLGSPVAEARSNMEARGIPREMIVPEIEAVLEQYGARSFLIHSDWSLLDAFREKTSWQLKQEVPYDPGTLYVYVRPRQGI